MVQDVRAGRTNKKMAEGVLDACLFASKEKAEKPDPQVGVGYALLAVTEALSNIASAIGKLGDSVAQDEPLNYSVQRGFKEVAEAVETYPR